MTNLKAMEFTDGATKNTIKANSSKVTCMVKENFTGLKVKFTKEASKTIKKMAMVSSLGEMALFSKEHIKMVREKVKAL